MEKAYEHKLVEDRIYDFWIHGGYFNSEPNHDKEKFVIMMPPPNITGRLHIGHALNFTLQDIFTRFNRMLGKETLWLPGIDHAGIATQSVVERELVSKGIKKEVIGREKFVEEVWKWKETYGNTIIEQLKKLGASPDWRRLRFTLDEKYANSVLDAFVKYYNDGLLYRGERIINWCPRCHTALSDIEVVYTEEKALLYYIKYSIEDSSLYITVATTRPETMLGDTAVAVNPLDERYKDLIGKYVILPIVERRIPIIPDDAVDPNFGTGAVKVTPSHSMDDFEIALRHKLPFLNVIDDHGNMINVPTRFAGLSSIRCREVLAEELKEKGYLLKIEDYIHSIGHCQRCNTVVEPLISKQWFLKMKPLAEQGKRFVEDKIVDLTPEKWVKVYYEWLNNIKDWCISRQLWWGHRIPAYYCSDCSEIIVSKGPVEKCNKCGSKNIKQDEDVLDTWFSSALWPFATLGWPEKTEDFEYYYPTTLLITGYDILFFWVARMIMSGAYFTQKQPFDTVMLHGLVRDEKGRKMSKSLKNIVDPLDLIDEFGADALRFTLVYLSTVGGQDVNLSKEKLKASRNFINKIWNASRFVLMNLEGFDPYSFNKDLLNLELEDYWILSRINKVILDIKELLNSYDPGAAARELYEFVWGEFCDWYIELSKIRLYSENSQEKQNIQYLLWTLLTKILKMLHPFIPFVTEEIYSYLPKHEDALIIASFPEVEEAFINEAIEKDSKFIFEIIRGIRSIKTSFNIPIVKLLNCFYSSLDERETSILENQTIKISKLAGLSSFRRTETKPEKTVKIVISGTTIFLELPSEINIETEKERLKKKLEEINLKVNSLSRRLINPAYLSKADPDIIEKDKDELKELEKTKEVIFNHLEDLA